MTITSKYTENENDWANDIKDNPIHISQAESGAKGYYCMGCTKEMQAVKKKNPKHQSYFRHHVKDVDHSKTECVHASRVYRERLAYLYFMRVKEIKVPAVYKFPPKREDGHAVLLQEAKTIVATRVARELTFYENDDGEIKWGTNPEIEQRYLHVRPDAVFFDENDKPILFLEFVVTHKPDIEKLIKLRRLGIDTVQIIVPKLPEAELEKKISSVTKVKWAYNEIESNTEYLPPANGYPEGIPFIDEEQRKLFEENLNCRAIQINNLIRQINKCLGSEHYRRIEQLFEQEISRIENATREHQSRLDEIRAGIESEISAEFRVRREQLEKEEEGFREYNEDLGDRYITKRAKLTREQENLDREVQLRYGIGESESAIRDRFRAAEERWGNDFEREFSTIARDIVSENSIIKDYRGHEERIQREIDAHTTFERGFGKLEENLKQEFDRLESEEQQYFEIEQGKLYSESEDFGQVRKRLEDKFRHRFEREQQQIAERIHKGDIQGGDELSERIKTILELRRAFGSYENDQQSITRIEEATRVIQDGTFKKWD